MNWSYTYDPQIWPALVTAILTAILGWYAWQRRNVSGAKPFVVICLFAFLWAVGIIFEISAIDFSSQVFWIKFQGIWQMPEATAWLWFVLRYAGFNRWLTRRNLWLMILPSFVVGALIITNYRNLLWKDFQMGDHVIQVFGIANWIIIAYASILVLATITVLLWLVIRSPHLRGPATIMLLGMTIAFGIYVLVNIDTRFVGPGERILLTMGISSLSFSLALFRFRALDPVPLAYSAIIKQMQEGVLVLDLQKKVVDLNPAAGQILGIPAKSLWGRPATEIFPVELSISNWLEKPEMMPSEIRMGNGSDIHYYNLRFTLLKDRRDRALGHLLLFHDITEQKRAQKQILKQQRVVATLQERERLARELHDGVGQVLGYANIQMQAINNLILSGDSDKARTALNRLRETVKDAHGDVRESILNLKAYSSQEWSFLPTLKQYLNNFQANFGIHTELSTSDGLIENNFDTEVGVQILRVIQEALTNSRKHSSARNVRVTFEPRGNRAHITIIDDGTGFDPGQVKPEAGHFGLGFMRQRMEQIGGSLKIDTQPGAGTEVKLEVPIQNHQEKTE
jgi:PAS domain S-box-containing protein